MSPTAGLSPKLNAKYRLKLAAVCRTNGAPVLRRRPPMGSRVVIAVAAGTVQPSPAATTGHNLSGINNPRPGPGLASPLDTSVTTVKLCVSTKHPPSLPPPDTGSGQVGAAYWRAVSAARARARPPPDPVSAISIYLCVFTPGNIHRVYLGYWTSLHSLTSQLHQHQQCFLLKLHFSNHLQINSTN